MDVNQLRVGVTLLSFVAFIGIFVWAWRRRNAADFSAAAELIFDEPGAARGPGETP